MKFLVVALRQKTLRNLGLVEGRSGELVFPAHSTENAQWPSGSQTLSQKLAPPLKLWRHAVSARAREY